jgi:hypothetical protein
MAPFGLTPSYSPTSALKSLYLTPTPQPAQGYMRPPPAPTLGERVTNFVASKAKSLGLPQHIAQKAADLVDYSPVGAVTTAYQLGSDLRQGNYGSALGNAVGTALNAIPDVGPIAKGMFGGGAALHSIIAPLFHGSPHAFEKFALDKIGTGEGAQAYGHGLYFAENPAVAKEYQKQTAGDGFLTAGGQVFDPSTLGHMNVRSVLNRTGSLDAAIAKANELLPTASAQTRPLLVQDAKTLTGLAQNGGISRNAGHLYEVSLDANPEDFLNWDAPLAQQPVAGRLPFEAANFPTKTGGDLVQYGLGNSHAGYLMDKGIPGIRYLDQGSRGVGGGTSNYVVFDPSIIDILARH